MSKRGRSSQKEPLYRRVNTLARRVEHHLGGEYRWSRHKKDDDTERLGSMHAGLRRGLDYTPLFRFLMARVGQDWNDVHSEASSRLDRPEPIFWLVAINEADKKPFVRVGESSYYSGLHVDDGNRLALVDATLTVEQMEPSCACCTHTLNGVPFTRPYLGGVIVQRL